MYNENGFCLQNYHSCNAHCKYFCYLCQVNRVNGGDTVFVRCVSVCIRACVSVCSGPVNQTSLKWLKLRTSNLTCMFPGTVRTTLQNFSKGGICKNSLDGDLLVVILNSVFSCTKHEISSSWILELFQISLRRCVTVCVGAGADRAGVDDDQRVGGPLEHVEEWTFHRRWDRWHGRYLDDSFQKTSENVAGTQSELKLPFATEP